MDEPIIASTTSYMVAVMIRLNAAEAEEMMRAGTLGCWLQGFGLETRTMHCRREGDDLVYEGARVTKDNPWDAK